jgi:hypothetical protein
MNPKKYLENVKNLATYLPDQLVEVNIENLNFKSQQNDLIQHLEKCGIHPNYLEYEWDKYRNRFTGRAFVTVEYQDADKIVKLNHTVENN